MIILEPLHLSLPKDAWGGGDTVEAEDGQFLLLVNYCATSRNRKAKKQPRMYF